MFDAQPRVPVEPIAPTEQQCKDAAVIGGGTEADGETFYVQYGKQGFLCGNGCAMTNLRLAMVHWLKMQRERGPQASNESTADRLKRIEEEKRV